MEVKIKKVWMESLVKCMRSMIRSSKSNFCLRVGVKIKNARPSKINFLLKGGGEDQERADGERAGKRGRFGKRG